MPIRLNDSTSHNNLPDMRSVTITGRGAPNTFKYFVGDNVSINIEITRLVSIIYSINIEDSNGNIFTDYSQKTTYREYQLFHIMDGSFNGTEEINDVNILFTMPDSDLTINVICLYSGGSGGAAN